MSPNRDPLDDDITPLPFECDAPNTPEGRQMRLELTVNATWRAVRKLGHRFDQILPTLVTHTDCHRRHPGAERVLKSILLVVAVLAAIWSAWKFMITAEHNEALAAQFRAGWPAPRPSAPIPVPSFVPVPALDAAQPPLEPQPIGRPKRAPAKKVSPR